MTRIDRWMRRERGSTRSSRPLASSSAQTAPKPLADRPEAAAQRNVRDDPRGRLALRAVAPLQPADDGDEREQQHDGGGAGEHRPRRQRAPQRAAALLALRGLPQLQLQRGHEVMAHPALPIRRRTDASPRLTRLRTTASDVSHSCARSR